MMKICWESDRNGGLTCDFWGAQVLQSLYIFIMIFHMEIGILSVFFSGQSPIMMGRAAACDSGSTFDD